MVWMLLLVAVVLEVVWAVSLKVTDGYTRLWPTVVNVVTLVLNLYVLAHVFKLLPLGTAYAIWTGLGAAGVALCGIYLYNESADILRLLCMALIISGVVGLKLLSPN